MKALYDTCMILGVDDVSDAEMLNGQCSNPVAHISGVKTRGLSEEELEEYVSFTKLQDSATGSDLVTSQKEFKLLYLV